MLKNIIDQGIKNGEFRKVDSLLVGKFLNRLIRFHQFEFFLESVHRNIDVLDFEKMEVEILNLLDIFLEGLKNKK
jgi:hypothetical protein